VSGGRGPVPRRVLPGGCARTAATLAVGRDEVVATVRARLHLRLPGPGRTALTVAAVHALVRSGPGGDEVGTGARVVCLTELVDGPVGSGSPPAEVVALPVAGWADEVARLLAPGGRPASPAPPRAERGCPGGLPPYVALAQPTLAAGAAMVAAGRLDLLPVLLAEDPVPVRVGTDARHARPLDAGAAARLLRDLVDGAEGSLTATVTRPTDVTGAQYLRWTDGWRRLRPVRRGGHRLVELVAAPDTAHAALLVVAASRPSRPSRPVRPQDPSTPDRGAAR